MSNRIEAKLDAVIEYLPKEEEERKMNKQVAEVTLRCRPPWDGTLAGMGEHGDRCWFVVQKMVFERGYVTVRDVCGLDGQQVQSTPCRNVEKLRDMLRVLATAIGCPTITEEMP